MRAEERAKNFAKNFPKYSPLVVHNNRLYGFWLIGRWYASNRSFYGSYPPSYLARVRSLFPDCERVLHLFSGSLQDVRLNEVTYDIKPEFSPTICDDARNLLQHFKQGEFDLILADPPYEIKDFEKYGCKPFNKRRSLMPEATCWVCSSNKFIDDHHYDCKEGKLSPEKVPLCRRCHRTYHDLGINYFEDEYLDKAIEIENKRREILGQQPLLKREDIRRSDYWNKIHGIKPEHPLPKKGKVFPGFQMPHGEPLCGWEWLHRHTFDLIGWVPRIEIIHPNFKVVMDIDDTKKLKDAVKVLRGLKKIA